MKRSPLPPLALGLVIGLLVLMAMFGDRRSQVADAEIVALQARVDSLAADTAQLAEDARLAKEEALVAEFEAESARALARAARAQVVIVHDSGVRVGDDTTIHAVPPQVVLSIRTADVQSRMDSAAIEGFKRALVAETLRRMRVEDLLVQRTMQVEKLDRIVTAERKARKAERVLYSATIVFLAFIAVVQ